MNDDILILEKVYLYDIDEVTNILRMTEGSLYSAPKGALYKNYRRFKTPTRETLFAVAYSEGQVYTNQLWLFEPNRMKAIDLLIQHEKIIISDCLKKADAHSKKLEGCKQIKADIIASI